MKMHQRNFERGLLLLALLLSLVAIGLFTTLSRESLDSHPVYESF